MTKKTTLNVARSQESRWQRNNVRKTAEVAEATALGISVSELKNRKWKEVQKIIGPQKAQPRQGVVLSPPPAQERRPQREPYRFMFP